ncbi:HNH endonuclease [Anaeromicropila populeti]|uniref:A nuclease of the HNH/ENDO VII superfamily with conserved WHH n=1 Tax=Anaeromicropila populeti TaxID=37658 RepID=A0A1I6JWU8_9FIRM|nr:HNH endonuclease [Anaeromicropila populeti]SFR83423.1 A nuclease of the HNH/ENDO VII superfamily with conserved WHH [Anaeromicropila populeti]
MGKTHTGAAIGNAGKIKIKKIDLAKLGLMGRKKVTTYTDLSQLTKEQLKTKPKYSPDIKKWFDKNIDGGAGSISIDENGIWTYYDWEGNHVSYPNGYPDFKNAEIKPVVIQEVPLDEFKNYGTDYSKADKKAMEDNKQPRNIGCNLWHHHEDGHTMQEISVTFHRRFTHRGGMAKAKCRKGDKIE